MPRLLDRAAAVLCWVARIAGLLLALFYLAFVIGEGVPSFWNHAIWTPQMRIHLLGLAAIAAGLLLAWKWEALGGLVTLAGFTLLWANGKQVLWHWSPLFLIPAVVALLHLACWLRLRGASPGRLPRVIWIAIFTFLLLCANEIFGNPPLMTPRRPGSDIVGSWHASRFALTVAPNGSVYGTVDGHPLAPSRVQANRTWFGRLMHWRTDYTVQGTVNGFFWLTGPHLNGDLSFRDGRKVRFEVVR